MSSLVENLRYIEAMAAAPQFLTIEEFDNLYAHEAGWEYWFGKAILKPVPTRFHGLLLFVVQQLFRQANYIGAAEVDLRARKDWRPRPDAGFWLAGQAKGKIDKDDYALTFDVVVEIRSEGQDELLFDKCKNYARLGIPQIFVFDPVKRTIKMWNNGLVEVENIHLKNDRVVTGESIWSAFDKEVADLGG